MPNVSESLLGKGAARRGFEIFFKLNSFLPVGEGSRSFHTPGFIFRSMSNIPGIMCLEAGVKVLCKTGIESIVIDLRLQDVNIIELHRPLPKAPDFAPYVNKLKSGLPRHSSCRAVAGAQQVEMTRSRLIARLRQLASARHTSLRPKFRSEVWRRRESNPRPRTFRQSIYIHSLCFKFALPNSHRQDSRRTIL